jgi:catechol 2,3-dioxygenase-like lactoylglutathione lyase family enzyme
MSLQRELWFWRSAACASGMLALTWMRCGDVAPRVLVREEVHPVELLHWLPGVDRRGLEDLVIRVNHVAIIVADVGRSLAFYTDILGFQQVQRPNFDRHGAWLTMGNLELHLIKGKPHAPSGEDLIVGHMALDTDYPERVLQKLIQMNVPFRQNVSVPDPKKARANQEENFDSADGKVTQYFIRDPDGYYIEICNCEVLTKFCLFNEEDVVGYAENCKPKCLPAPMLFKVKVRMLQLVRKARASLHRGLLEQAKQELNGVRRADEVDGEKLAALIKRQNTFGDITQAFSASQIKEALLIANNQVAQAVILLELKSLSAGKMVLVPPQYLVGDEKLQPKRFSQHYLVKRMHGNSYRFSQSHMPKPFADEAGAVTEQAHRAGKAARQTVQHRESFLGALKQHLPEVLTQTRPRGSHLSEIWEGEATESLNTERFFQGRSSRRASNRDQQAQQ